MIKECLIAEWFGRHILGLRSLAWVAFLRAFQPVYPAARTAEFLVLRLMFCYDMLPNFARRRT